MRRTISIVGLGALALALAAGVWAASSGRFIGTAKNDVLRGTPRADALDGRAGNDRLAGLGGNDVLVGGSGNDTLAGGPGTDRIRCGAGVDRVNGAAGDVVSRDCEDVRGLPPAEPPPAPPQPPPPPPPAAELAKPGHYCGFTGQGKSVCFDVTDGGTRVANMATTSDVDCEVGRIPDLGLSFSGSVPIRADRTFTFAYEGPVTSGDPDVTNISTSYSVTGTFDANGNAAGRLNLNRFSFDYQGQHFDCAAAGYAWSARVGA